VGHEGFVFFRVTFKGFKSEMKSPLTTDLTPEQTSLSLSFVPQAPEARS